LNLIDDKNKSEVDVVVDEVRQGLRGSFGKNEAVKRAEGDKLLKTDVNKGLETEVDAIKQKRDEEISACFEAAKKKLDGLLTSKKKVIRDLACELERLGRRTEDIAAEIVAELSDCEEISKSLIYAYLDDKYKDQAQAQRRKGKKLVPETGTETATCKEQENIIPPLAIKTSVSGQEVVEAEPETQKVDSRNAGGIDTDVSRHSVNGEISASKQNEATRYVSHIPVPFVALQKDLTAINRTNNGKVGNVFFKISVDLGKLVGQIECCGITPQKDVTMISIGKGKLEVAGNRISAIDFIRPDSEVSKGNNNSDNDTHHHHQSEER
jgi:hypothetical protein